MSLNVLDFFYVKTAPPKKVHLSLKIEILSLPPLENLVVGLIHPTPTLPTIPLAEKGAHTMLV